MLFLEIYSAEIKYLLTKSHIPLECIKTRITVLCIMLKKEQKEKSHKEWTFYGKPTYGISYILFNGIVPDTVKNYFSIENYVNLLKELKSHIGILKKYQWVVLLR